MMMELYSMQVTIIVLICGIILSSFMSDFSDLPHMKSQLILIDLEVLIRALPILILLGGEIINYLIGITGK